MGHKKKILSRKMVWRSFKALWGFYPRLLPAILGLIFLNAGILSLPAVFMQKVVAVLEDAWTRNLSWSAVRPEIYGYVRILALLYLVSLAANVAYNQLLAVFNQGCLAKIREKLFTHMETLPLGYFDRHQRGDIMSYYTNDVEALRQLISQAFPQLFVTAVTLTVLLAIMLYYSVWMSLVVVGGSLWSVAITRKVGGRSARYFMEQQHTLGACEGFMEESINGSKVIRVFNHEKATRGAFDQVNQALYEASYQANRYSNTLMPILNNVSYLIYIIVAACGGLFLERQVPNLSLSGLPFSLAVMVPFLGMSRQFAANIQMISPQINAMVMGMAGAERIFGLLEEEPEEDRGTVELRPVEGGAGVRHWAWVIPQGKGREELRPLTGEVHFRHVSFGYEKGKPILQDISLDALPGQKIALVGATGAGKTTITNLLTRFYDISSGTITYDGIPLEQIRKGALRRSLGMVLQNTVLFTATVLENIRYGRLEATDEECVAAAKLAGADDFIRHLPQGYRTVLKGAGAGLSQGQCQLLAIARAAVADSPVMILDEATSSIDTRTEQIVQRGMDALMEGRTVFVIAHRLSTVRNADQILVLDHGKIKERGTHQQLLDQKGMYWQLYTGAFELE